MDDQSSYGQAPFNFILPRELNASEPPEKRGIVHDNVKPYADCIIAGMRSKWSDHFAEKIADIHCEHFRLL